MRLLCAFGMTSSIAVVAKVQPAFAAVHRSGAFFAAAQRDRGGCFPCDEMSNFYQFICFGGAVLLASVARKPAPRTAMFCFQRASFVTRHGVEARQHLSSRNILLLLLKKGVRERRVKSKRCNPSATERCVEPSIKQFARGDGSMSAALRRRPLPLYFDAHHYFSHFIQKIKYFLQRI